jgi:hypothetical protein
MMAEQAESPRHSERTEHYSRDHAHEVAKFLAALEDADLAELDERGIGISWISYSLFGISITDRDAPDSLGGHFFMGDLEQERFVHQDMIGRPADEISTARVFVEIGKLNLTKMRVKLRLTTKTREFRRMFADHSPVSDELAETLLGYLQERSESGGGDDDS